MCGIYGILGGPGEAADAGILAIQRDLVNRGPDAQGVFASESLKMGMNRLHLWGDAASAVPFAVDDSVLSYNGEIYGHLYPGDRYVENLGGGADELRFFKQHDGRGLADGMYAIAEFDDRSKALTLTRDRFGIKPAFYGRRPDGSLVFSSCLRSFFLEDVGFPRQLRPSTLFDVFAYGFSLTGHTAFEGIDELLPGHRLHAGSGGVSVAPSIDPSWSAGGNPGRDWRRMLRQSVVSCAKGNYPIGLAVSGGVDSTILAMELDSLGIEGISTFSVVLEEAQDGIEHLSQLGLPRGGAWETWTHHHVRVSREMFKNHMMSSTRQFAYPTDMHSLPLYAALAEIVKEAGIRVLLTGEGADEYFMGYEKYRTYSGPQEPGAFYLGGDKGRFIREIFDADIVKAGTQRADRFSAGDFWSQVRQLEIRARLQKLLLRTDVILMEHGIEGRTPFLHSGLPEAALAVPPLEALGRTGKQMLRDAYKGELAHIASAPKRRFKAPEKLFWEVFESAQVREVLFDSIDIPGVDFGGPMVERILGAYHGGNQSDLSELLFLIFTTKRVMRSVQ